MIITVLWFLSCAILFIATVAILSFGIASLFVGLGS